MGLCSSKVSRCLQWRPSFHIIWVKIVLMWMNLTANVLDERFVTFQRTDLIIYAREPKILLHLHLFQMTFHQLWFWINFKPLLKCHRMTSICRGKNKREVPALWQTWRCNPKPVQEPQTLKNRNNKEWEEPL